MLPFMGSDEDACCFLVASPLGQDLLFCAKHLFVAASLPTRDR
jgi:hypothetical protein